MPPVDVGQYRIIANRLRLLLWSRPVGMNQSDGGPERCCRWHSARKLLFCCKGTKTEPGLHGRGKLRVSGQHHPPACNRSTHGIKSHPDGRHAAEVDGHVELDIEAGVD